MFFQTRHRVARYNFFRGAKSNLDKGQENQRDRQKFWGKCYVGPNTVSEIWPQKGQPLSLELEDHSVKLIRVQ